MRISIGLVVLLASAGCGKVNPCGGKVARCDGNVAVSWVETGGTKLTLPSGCAEHRVDCDAEAQSTQVGKTCKAGPDAAYCVDVPLEPCQPTEQGICDAAGHVGICAETNEGSFASGAVCSEGEPTAVCAPDDLSQCFDGPLTECNPAEYPVCAGCGPIIECKLAQNGHRYLVTEPCQRGCVTDATTFLGHCRAADEVSCSLDEPPLCCGSSLWHCLALEDGTHTYGTLPCPGACVPGTRTVAAHCE